MEFKNGRLEREELEISEGEAINMDDIKEENIYRPPIKTTNKEIENKLNFVNFLQEVGFEVDILSDMEGFGAIRLDCPIYEITQEVEFDEHKQPYNTGEFCHELTEVLIPRKTLFRDYTSLKKYFEGYLKKIKSLKVTPVIYLESFPEKIETKENGDLFVFSASITGVKSI